MLISKDQTCGTPHLCICGRCNIIDINQKANEELHKKNVEHYERLLELAKRLA